MIFSQLKRSFQSVFPFSSSVPVTHYMIRAGTLSLLNKDKDLQISLHLVFLENVQFIGLYPTLFEDKVGLNLLDSKFQTL